jgi:hypothetical protein
MSKPTRAGKHPRQGWTCQRCQSLTKRTITVQNEQTGERLALCGPCITAIIGELRQPARQRIARLGRRGGDYLQTGISC